MKLTIAEEHYKNLSEKFIRDYQNEINWDYVSQYSKLSNSFRIEFNNKIIEVWKNIPGFEELYQASTFGRIMNKQNNIILKEYSHYKGYKMVNLLTKEKYKLYTVHRLIGLTFIEKIKDKNQINHKNGDKSDNRIFNLEWMNGSENCKHKFDILGYKLPNRIKKEKQFKIKNDTKSKEVKQYDLNMKLVNTFYNSRLANKITGISYKCISFCCTGKTKTAGGYIWRYSNE